MSRIWPILKGVFNPLYLLGSLLMVPLVAGALGLLLFQASYANRAYPGVRLQGTDVGGMRVEEIFRIAQKKGDTYFQSPNVTLRIADKQASLRPADLGAGLDAGATTLNALSIGRDADLWSRLKVQARAWWLGIDVAPVVTIDEATAQRVINDLARDTRRTPRSAALTWDKGAPQEVVAQAGQELNVEAALAVMRSAALEGQPIDVTLQVLPVPPKVASASSAMAAAKKLVSGDLVVTVPRWDKDGKPLPNGEAFRLKAADLPNYTRLEEVPQADGAIALDLKIRREKFAPLIAPLAALITGTAENALFTFDEKTKQLVVLDPGKPERQIDAEATLNAIEKALLTDGAHTVMAQLKLTAPEFSAATTAQQLGITGLVAQGTTFFKGSSAERMKNVKVAASRFHGIVIKPGETFSFNKYLGEVTAEEGFEEGLVIVGDRTIKGVGGGVCQVSTTAYQAALKAGFTIKERLPHGYRVGYYERGMGPGLDATVFEPYVDLKFVNDTAAHILIETYYDGANATLTFKFYGAPDNREVTFTKPVISNIIKHAPDIYEPDPEGKVPPKTAKQVDYAVDGATISLERIVKKDGKVIQTDKLVSRYVPWQAVFRYGPGFVPPEGAIVRP
jgi:vancomycin resistance protein YoaR